MQHCVLWIGAPQNSDLTIRLQLLTCRQFPAASLAMALDVGGPAKAATTDVARVLGLAVHVAVLAQVAILLERLATHLALVLARRFVKVALYRVHHRLPIVNRGPCSPLKTRTNARQPRSRRLQNQAAGILRLVLNGFCIASQAEQSRQGQVSV